MVPRSSSKRDSKKFSSPPGREAVSSRSGPKPSAFVLGEALEYRIARLHLFMGYFVRRGCPIYTVAALDRATDLDVLATRYIEPFERQMIIAECKSGENAPLDRIFWLSGVKRYTKASEALLVRKATKWNIKDFAKECGVRVIDLQRLSEIEASLGIHEDEWPGISDREFFSREIESWNASLKANVRYWELALTLTSEIRWEEPFAGANYLLSQLRLLTRAFPQYPNDSFHRYLFTEAIAQLSLFLLRIVEQTFDLAERDRHGLIRNGLIYGNLNPKYAERILESAYNLSRQSVLHYTNQRVDLDRQLFSMPEPPGTDGLIGFLETLVKGYPPSLIFPQVLDYILLERFTKRKEMRRVLRRMFPQAALGASIGLAQQFLSTLVSIGACPSYIEEIFSRSEAEQPHPEVKPTQSSTDVVTAQPVKLASAGHSPQNPENVILAEMKNDTTAKPLVNEKKSDVPSQSTLSLSDHANMTADPSQARKE